MKKTNAESYIEEPHEQDSCRMRDHINSNHAEKRTAEMEEREKVRTTALCQYALRCVADVIIFVALFGALKARLIASALVIPATYLFAIRFGWCWSKVVCFAKKGRGSK